MSQVIWKSLLISPVLLGTALMSSLTTHAAEYVSIQTNVIAQASVPVDTSIAEGNQINALDFSPSANSDSQSYSLDQVNSISQFSDVSQQDWAFEALRNLVENYGCLVGYPDGTYRGERPLTRYEFAAGLNACLQQVERQGTRPAATAETPAGSYQSQDSLADVFNRAFFNSTGQFFDQVNLSGQFNAMFGWRSFPQGSFRENQITDDAETLSVLMRDVLKQQSNGTPPLRTRDLANPFDTSLRDNPSYLSPAEQRSANREVIINIEQKPLSP